MKARRNGYTAKGHRGLRSHFQAARSRRGTLERVGTRSGARNAKIINVRAYLRTRACTHEAFKSNVIQLTRRAYRAASKILSGEPFVLRGRGQGAGGRRGGGGGGAAIARPIRGKTSTTVTYT